MERNAARWNNTHRITLAVDVFSIYANAYNFNFQFTLSISIKRIYVGIRSISVGLAFGIVDENRIAS